MKHAIFDHMDGAGTPLHHVPQLYFGDMSPDEASRSASLFAEHIAGVSGTRAGAKPRQELEVMSPI